MTSTVSDRKIVICRANRWTGFCMIATSELSAKHPSCIKNCLDIDRSTRTEMFCRNAALVNSQKNTCPSFWWSNFIKRRLHYFNEFCKFFRIALIENPKWLFLYWVFLISNLCYLIFVLNTQIYGRKTRGVFRNLSNI